MSVVFVKRQEAWHDDACIATDPATLEEIIEAMGSLSDGGVSEVPLGRYGDGSDYLQILIIADFSPPIALPGDDASFRTCSEAKGILVTEMREP